MEKVEQRTYLETLSTGKPVYFTVFPKLFIGNTTVNIGVLAGKILLVFMERVKNCDRCHVLFQEEKKRAGQEIYFNRFSFRVVCLVCTFRVKRDFF